MRAIAEWGILRLLAAAKIHRAGLLGLEAHGACIAALVGAVTEGLTGAFAAGAPGVGFACFDVDGVGSGSHGQVSPGRGCVRSTFLHANKMALWPQRLKIFCAYLHLTASAVNQHGACGYVWQRILRE